ncbi:hypothetical protein F4861DRAFT_117403 [Xylaria intraflava]|nr:hypothetical protein F4861DRAFT_117403 [Xylaria intraflava]
MSSPNSSSSQPPRTPLHGRTNSESAKQQIRLVPITPPAAEAEESALHTPVPDDAGNDGDSHGTNDGSSGTPTPVGRGRFLRSASLSSSSSPIAYPPWISGRNVSESRLVSNASSAEQQPVPPTPMVIRTSNTSSIRHVNAAVQQPQSRRDDGPSHPPIRTKPLARRNRVLSINSDKTFSIVLKPTQTQTQTQVSTGSQSTLKSYPYSNASLGSHEGVSFDAPTDEHPSSLFSSQPGRSVSVSSSEAPTVSSALNEDHGDSSGNFRMVGGLRQVPKASDPKDKGKGKEIATEPLPTLPETIATITTPKISSLAPKASFVTDNSNSTLEETTNYKVIGRSSPPQAPDSAEVSPSSSSSNYRLLGQSSAPQSLSSSPTRGQSVLDTPGSRNFVVHESPYPASESISLETPKSKNFTIHSNASPSSWMYPASRVPRSPQSFDSFRQQTGENYSQESLIIPPLRTHRRSSSETTHLKHTLRESAHRRSNSYSSISSVLTEDTGPNVVPLGRTPSASSHRQPSWTGRRSVGRPVSRMDVHQWSSQLSTVMSDYEDSDRASRLTRINSLGSSVEGASSSLGSPGISSLLQNLEPSRTTFHSHSRTGSLDRPNTVMRMGREHSNSLVPTIRDHDEHGDGLADLQAMHQLQSKSSRTRLGFLSRQSSDKSLRSSISSRSGSTTNSIPTWARLYYGSGEIRWFATPSVISEDDDGRPTTLWVPGGSASPSEMSQNIHNPRRRPRESQYDVPQMIPPEVAAAEIGSIPREPKKKTSSIWSPHLGLDLRANRYDMWRPPSVTWSVDNGVFGRRNIQVVLFVLGFVFPFAWMTAAFLPLPPKPRLDMEELGHSTTQLQIPEDARPEPVHPRVVAADDSRYQSARWWRNVNRFMSIIGFLILGAIIALIVIGIRQGWGK